MASTVLYCWILYLSVAVLLIMMSIVLHRTWGVTKVYFDKSEIFVSGLLDDQIHRLIEPLGIKEGKLPVKYLGVPLISGRLSFTDCKPLIDKITQRIRSWGVKKLSFAGRIQLIQSVVQGITQYWCTHFILPKKVLK